MAETLSTYIDGWLTKAASGGLRNPLLKMPIKRFRLLAPEELASIESGRAWKAGTLSDPVTRNLWKNYEEKIRERGEHTGFVTRGSVEIKLDGVSGAGQRTALMPVWLQRVSFRKKDDALVVEALEEKIWDLNPELDVFAKQLGVSLGSAPKGSPDRLTRWLAVQFGNRATVLDTVSYLGCFSSQHLIIRERVKDWRWRRGVAQNDLIRARIMPGSAHAAAEAAKVTDDSIEQLGLVMPVDDSQLRVVQIASAGHSMVVQGPPGTGKSQTIANLISNAWWHGKRVLLVCDKRTAIQQVEERLEKCGLGPALLNLHDEGLDKHAFLKQATARFPKNGSSPVNRFQELAALREVLNRRIVDGEEIAHGALGVKRRDAVAGMIRLRERLGSIPKLDIPGWKAVSKGRLTRLFAAFGEWEALDKVIAEEASVWNSALPSAFRADPNSKNELLSILDSVSAAIEDVGRLREFAAALGYQSSFGGFEALEHFSSLAKHICDRPTYYLGLIQGRDLSVEHAESMQQAALRRARLLQDRYPIELNRTQSEEALRSVDALLSDEGASTWDELKEAEAEYARSIDAIGAVNRSYNAFASEAGLEILDSLGERKSQLATIAGLQATEVSIPENWWDTSKASPAAILSRWSSEIEALSEHAMSAPLPIDLAAVARTTDAQWAALTAKAEDGFNAVSYCFRFVNDRKAKAALAQIYPKADAKGKRPWSALVLHATKARDILREVEATSLLHPVLRELTAAYLASSLKAPSTLDFLRSDDVVAIRNAARQVESLRLRTDYFHCEGPLWRVWWLTPNVAKRSNVQQLSKSVTETMLPETAGDSVKEGLRFLEGRRIRIREFLREHIRGAGETTHDVMGSFEAQREYVECGQKLSELSRYQIIPGACSTPPNWNEINSALFWREEFERLQGARKLDLDNSDWQHALERSTQILEQLDKALNELAEFFRGARSWAKSFASLIANVDQIRRELPRLDQWLIKLEWDSKINAWPELNSIWARLKKGETKVGDAKPLFCYNFLRLSAPPIEPNGPELAEKLKLFSTQDEMLEKWTVDSLIEKIKRSQASAAALHSGQYSEINRLAGLQRVRGTVRELCNSHLDVLLATKPGWLMSPISLANLIDLDALDPEKPLFDVLIFDEASQIQVLEGLLAMGFAKQTIVVGDEKQLPPTSFFASMATDGDETEDLGDSESLIEEFQGVARSAMLTAHYRSETPDLISFSNRKFYEGRLEMFPPAKVSGTGRRRVFVANGIFDSGKTRTNMPEAERVVQLVREHVVNVPSKSLGIVTMNVEQMELIETLLLDADVNVRQFIADDEKFFIRNLETVQGDEMDRIIVSLTYGKNREGRFNASVLGPLTRKGGHRRLNVALSRSRNGMTIVTSMTAADLAQTSAQSYGFTCLKELLEELETQVEGSNFGVTHARFSKRADGISEMIYCESPFEEQVVEFLENSGCTLRCQVGAGDNSQFRLDIVVVENEAPILAIECDGAAYHSSHCARTRDRARQRQLERLGWKFHRVWSSNWWRYQDTEKQALLQAINDARRAAGPSRQAAPMGARIASTSAVSN